MTRRNWMLTIACGTCLLFCTAAIPVGAQDAERDRERRHELRELDQERRQLIEERIRERFTSMLRSELALSDEQAETVLPEMSELEQLKRELGRERHTTVRALQKGMQEGASDAELQESLDRLDRIEDDLRAAQRDAMLKIDGELNTRQRVKLRFFVHEFRQSIERRLGERNRMDRRPPRPGGSRRPNRP